MGTKGHFIAGKSNHFSCMCRWAAVIGHVSSYMNLTVSLSHAPSLSTTRQSDWACAVFSVPCHNCTLSTAIQWTIASLCTFKIQSLSMYEEHGMILKPRGNNSMVLNLSIIPLLCVTQIISIIHIPCSHRPPWPHNTPNLLVVLWPTAHRDM